MPANWMDHAIASVAPRMAARRILARQAFETLTRGYDGASKGRRTDGWRAPGSSADTEIGVAGALLRDRMRDLVRNNPHAAKAVAVLVNNIVGSGIMPRAASGDGKLDRKVDALFERWTADCDADGQLDFYGLQTLICREMVEAGEVLVRRRLRRVSDGLAVPLQLQVLEADFLDATKSSNVGAGRIVQGIEFDPVGKRRAYWLHPEHPGDAHGALRGGLDSRPVPATEIAHGTVSHPTLAATNLAASMRRWRLTSAALVDSAAEQRSAGWACWRGNATGLGGWTFVTRISLTTLQATGMGFFGLYGSTAALATTLALAAAINCIGIGFQRGTHTRWQLVANDGTGAPTLTDMGASFAIATGGVLTLFIAAPPNGGSVWVRVVDEVSGAVFEQEITADLPANTQFLSPRLFVNNGATAAAVAFDCSGVYVETDY